MPWAEEYEYDDDAYTPDEPDEDRDETETEDTGRWQSGYRVYRDGSYREDFRSDC